MTEYEYHIKAKIRVNWAVFIFGAFLCVIGTALMFTPVTEEVYLYSDEYYDYYTDVTTYPYVGAGVVVDTLGFLIVIASFFLGSEEEAERTTTANEKSINTKTNLKFERHTGFYGSAVRNWIDNNLPRCPFCKKPSLWEYTRKLLGFKALFKPSATRYFFRCPNCMSIISVAQEALEAIMRAPIIDVTELVVRKSINKNFKVESVGNNEKIQHLVGEEYPLEVLQERARQIHEGKKNEGGTRLTEKWSDRTF